MFLAIILIIGLAVVAYIWTARTRGAFRYSGSLLRSTFIYIHGARMKALAATVEDEDAAESFVETLDDVLVDSREYRKGSVKFAKSSRDLLKEARAKAGVQ